MTDEARADRLKTAGNIAAAWLGIPEGGAAKNGREICPRIDDRPLG